MTNAELIEALRCCASPDTPCKGLCPYHGVEYCLSKKDLDAADALEAAEQRIAELEAQLPKEGEWIKEPMTFEKFYNDPYVSANCSICGTRSRERGNYCPNCGAKMKGANDEQIH